MTVGVEYWRQLTEWDWLVSASWNRLHHAALTVAQFEVLEDETWIPGPIRLSCGRTATAVGIPGFSTRLDAPRCVGCCRALGYPPGIGSPKNDPACRILIKERP